jgi:uncharacterized protein (DUF305 family)
MTGLGGRFVARTVLTAAAALTAACVTGACGEATKKAVPVANAALPHLWVKADVDFMQGMIMHHAQALTMAALVPTHGRRADLKLLAEKITVSQRDEIRLMQTWLADRHQQVTQVPQVMNPRDDMGGMLMPGMLTKDQMAALAHATGAAFDSLFLTGMIQHHTGALTMVKTLFATPGAGQESEMYAVASDINAGQTAEIARMQAMLQTPTTPSSHSAK